MKLLSINQDLTYDGLDITFITESELASCSSLTKYDYIIIHGGDGTIRRVLKILHTLKYNAKFILNPTGSFNVIAKLHKVPKLHKVLNTLANNHQPKTQSHFYYTLNKEVFLFSAGNMGDLQHIFLSETLRFGLLKKGIAKYILAGLFLLPVHLIMTPFMLVSSKKFFIFTPASFIGKLGSFYGKIEEKITIDLDNYYNHIELDGDVVTIEESILEIEPASSIEIVI